MPRHETPRGFPPVPTNVAVSVVDKNTLEVSWSNGESNSPEIQAYRVERFCKSDVASGVSYSFFGEAEVVEFSTVGLGLNGGTFTVYLGELDTSAVFLGHAKAIKGLSYVETLSDLTARLQRGESILIGGDEYTAHPTAAFTASHLPLFESYAGEDNESIAVYARSKSMRLPFDVSEEEFQNALQQMPHVNHVHVRRETNDITGGHQWFLTLYQTPVHSKRFQLMLPI
jgi:hypothetical protein